MLCCFIRVICSLLNIKTAHSSLSTDHGTVHHCHRKDIMLYLFPLRTVNHPVNGKCLPVGFQDWKQVLHHVVHNIVRLVWHRALMVLCMYQTTRKEPFIVLYITENKISNEAINSWYFFDNGVDE